MESQITYWETYNANLQSLTERSADIEGLSEMIASFADGSEDSVNAIAGMAGATDEQLEAMVSNWQALRAEQEEAAGSVADLKTDFTAAMDELQTELAADIEAMDLGEEAIASGRATIQGYIDGASGMLPQVYAAYSRIGLAAQNALTLSAGASSIPGYAVGTQSAEEGFAPRRREWPRAGVLQRRRTGLYGGGDGCPAGEPIPGGHHVLPGAHGRHGRWPATTRCPRSGTTQDAAPQSCTSRPSTI